MAQDRSSRRTPSPGREGLHAARRMVDGAFVVLSQSAAALAEHRAAMRRGRALLVRSRAICAREVLPPWTPVAAPAEWRDAVPAGAALRAVPLCDHAGCGRPALFRPVFLVDREAHYLVHLKDLPLRVCAEHRDVCAGGRLLELVGRFLRARGRSAPADVQVAFQRLV